MLAALLSGMALTARELAEAAGVAPQTASGHLQALARAGLVTVRRQGRHRYHALSGPPTAHALETLLGLAAETGGLRHRPGPRDADLRAARICYDHLAGARAVQMFDALTADGSLVLSQGGVTLGDAGSDRIAAFGIDVAALGAGRRPLCRLCLDWSERRSHLAGALGAALLSRMEALGWLRRQPRSRCASFTPEGARAFDAAFRPACAPGAEACRGGSG